MFKRCVTMITLFSILQTLAATNARAGQPATAGAVNTPISSHGKREKKYCAPCSAGQQEGGPAGLDSLATLGRRTQPLPFAPLMRSLYDGANVNLVSTARGHLSFYVTDLALSGIMPVEFQRFYSSARVEDRGLGVGWSIAYDDRITLDGDSARLSTAAGSVMTFRRETGSQRFKPDVYEPGAYHSFYVSGPDIITERVGGITRLYQRLGGAYRLSRVADSNGNRIVISLDARGNITRIENGAGALLLKWSDGADARLLSVADGTGQAVSFRQDGQRLRAAVSSAGVELTYDYAGGRLTRALDPMGRLLLRVRYDRAGRVSEAGDAVGSYLFQYDSASGLSRRTIVTDPAGAQTIYEQTASGALTGVSQSGGQSARLEYDAAGRIVRATGPLGNETTFSYDAQNRLLRESSTERGEVAYAYDEEGRVSSVTQGGSRTDYTRDSRGNVVSATSDEPARSYTATFNERGQSLSVRSAAGRELSHEYDAAGRETAYSFAGIGRFETERDAAGRVVKERFPSGLSQSYEYDARGRLLRQSDSRGHSVTLERDASGALTGLITGGGRWVRAERDSVGRIVALSSSAGKMRRFGYDARGALVDYTDALGRRKRVRYDHNGRVREIAESTGRRTLIERDSLGRANLISLPGGTRLIYEYDRNGNPLNVRRESAGRDKARGMLAAVFNHATALSSTTSSPQLGFDCFFDYDGFYTSSGWGMDSSFGDFGWDPFGSNSDCFDPFGDSGGCGWSGGFDSWYSDPWGGSSCFVFGETCEQCMARQKQICERSQGACVARAVREIISSGGTCILTALATGGVGLFFCVLFGGGAAGASLSACSSELSACTLAALDKCPQCR